MLTDDFDFDLPKELIAQSPAVPRDAARLLVVGEALQDRRITDLPDLLRPGDLLVSNNTKVIPTRLQGTRVAPANDRGRGRSQVQVTLHKNESPSQWRAFARPAKRLEAGDAIEFTEGLQATVLAKDSGGEVTLDFNAAGDGLVAALERTGSMPLPPYIHRGSEGNPNDRHDYQTVFAKTPGAVAAPTAGLHFTPELLAALRQKGIDLCQLTLHVGAGTFLPVKSAQAEDHKMHAEFGELDPATAERINRCKRDGGRIVSVGTTSLRLLESAASDKEGQGPDQDPGQETVRPFRGETDIFILPGYRFRCVDLLLTNFHLPRSTLFMLVSAFSGLAVMKAAYQHAIAERYRFFSYGDACLLSLARPT